MKLNSYAQERVDWLIENYEDDYKTLLSITDKYDVDEDFSHEDSQQIKKTINDLIEKFAQWFSVSQKVAKKWVLRAGFYYQDEILPNETKRD